MSKRKRAREEASGEGDPRFHRDMLVATAVDADPGAAGVFLHFGLPCSKCIVAYHETIAQGCAPMGIAADEVVARLNGLVSGN